MFGPPADRAAAVAVLREAVALGITHIDTSDYYGPYVTNEIIREALHPYPESLHIVTKVGALRDAEGGWNEALAPDSCARPCTTTSITSASTCSTWSTCASAGFDRPARARSPGRSARSPGCGRRD